VIDTGSTTAVTQATGTNLHAVIDTGSTTAATQATASNLNAQVVGPGATGAALVGNPVRVALSDGTNTQNWLTALALNPTTGVNGNNTGAVVNYLYNGTAYVAAPGTLNGAYGIIRDAAGNARGANVNASNQLSTSVDASVLPTGAATSANQTTELASLSTIATNTGAAVPAGTAHIGTVGTAPYADGAVPITATATGTTAATTATLAASGSGLKTYICGFSIRANATAAVTNNATLTGVVTATMNFTQWTAPNASGLGVTEMIFSPCIPSSATNTAINVVSGAPGTGGVVSVSAWGYQL
jgi:hypothetical protein